MHFGTKKTSVQIHEILKHAHKLNALKHGTCLLFVFFKEKLPCNFSMYIREQNNNRKKKKKDQLKTIMNKKILSRPENSIMSHLKLKCFTLQL